MFIRNALVAKIPITGKVDATFTCDIFPESTNDQIYVDPTLPVIDCTIYQIIYQIKGIAIKKENIDCDVPRELSSLFFFR